jgi:hypothetical protein
MDIDSNFPTRVQTIGSVPEPLRRALEDNIPPNEQVRLVIYSPAFSTLEELTKTVLPLAALAPATVLAVLNGGWMVAIEEEDGLTIEKSTFDETLCLEVTSILLSGELKIIFASGGRHHAATIPFNTVREELYREAINLILDGIDHSPSFNTLVDDRPQPLLETWPIKTRADAKRYQPTSQRLMAATRWNAVTGGFGRNLSPAGALLLTNRTLISILDQQPAVRQRPGAIHRFGGTIAYFPIARLSDFHTGHHGRFGMLDLRLQAPHGHEKLELLFPSDGEKSVTKTVAWAFLNNRQI